MEHITFPSKDGVTKIHANIWLPQGNPRGIVQIMHGMAEYGMRYAPLCEYLSERGFVVGVNDHLGHGESVNDKQDWGYFTEGDGSQIVLDDLREFSLLLRQYAKDAPFFLLGHSMGSFFCRKFIALYGGDYQGAVIMGSGYQSGFMTGAGLNVTRMIAKCKGMRHRSQFVDDLAFGGYNKKFSPARTEYDWLSVNEQNVDAYVADEACGYKFTCSGFITLFSILRQACAKQTFLSTPQNLPIFLVAGDCDPVGDFGKAVKKLYDKYLQAGVNDVSLTLYKGARHEILNDISAEQVREDLLAFFEGLL